MIDMKQTQNGFINIALILILIILIGGVSYTSLRKNNTPSTPSSDTQVPTPTNPIPVPTPTNNVVSASLGQQFTLKKGQTATIAGTGLEIEITNFINSPCPKGAQCFWSGLGVEFTYRLNGQEQKGMNLAEAFGFHTTIVNTDYEKSATLTVERIYR
jgi:hypothetical protein